ncbi:MAG: ABC transporter substrate-binding protein [Treponema sp.]|jgi:peptide/nickel transport system substrate-binding protein|nr:ABC transporter substrate-binding protein [Treponema sp.]
MKKKMSFRVSFALILAIFVTFSCSRENDTNTLRFGFTTEPATLDPLNPSNTADGRSILFNVFEGLVKPDTTGMMQPCLAESWTVEMGGLVYNFNLREGVRFHDGSLLTSADVKYSLDTATNMGFHGLNAIEDIRIQGDRLITVVLKSPDPDFLPYLTIGIVKAGNTNRENVIVGTGPFFIESYRTQQNLVLKKFDDYWHPDLPYLDKVTIVFFENNDAQMIALRGGSIDGTNITGSMAALLDHRFFDLFHSYSASVQLLALNNAAVPLDDLRVRRALNYGIDIQNIIETAFFGAGAPSGSPIIPGLTAYYVSGLEYPYEPETAVSLLSQAGYNSHNKLSLEITVPSNYTMHVDTAQVIAGQLAKIGIDTSIKLVDWTTWLNDVYFGRQYMSTIISLDSPVVSPRSFLSRYRSGGGENFINFKNVDFDKIYDAVLAETDNPGRIRLYREAQQAITANAASVFIQDIYFLKVFRGGAFSGVYNYPLYVVDFASIYRIDKN